MASDKLAAATAYLEKQFGKGIVMNLTGAVNHNKTVSTGHPFIDWVMGGGMPYGKMVELFGPPSSGKTTLSMMIAAMAQKKKNKTGRVLWLDYEHAFDAKYFRRLGGLVDEDHLIVSQPETAEDGMEIARVMITNGLIDLMVGDSVAAMMSFKESGDWVDTAGNVVADGKGKQQGGMGENRIGLHSQVITQSIKQLQAKIGPPEVGIIWINQIRTKIATKPGQQTTETTTGGNAIKFYSGIRVELQRVKSIQGKVYSPIENKVLDKQIIAIETKVKGAKNRCAPPFREAVVTVGFGTGIETETDMLKMATAHKIVNKGKTGWYETQVLGGSRNARGDADFRKLLIEEPKVKKVIMDKILPLLDSLDNGMTVVVDEESGEAEQVVKAMSAKPAFAQPIALAVTGLDTDKPTITITENEAKKPSSDEMDALLESGAVVVEGSEETFDPGEQLVTGDASEGGDGIALLDDIASDIPS